MTRVRTPKNVDITIPNSMVLSNHIINYSARAKKTGVILHTTVTIGYDVPWAKVHELLLSAANATSRLEREPAPFVHQTALDDFYVHYELNATTRSPDQMSSIYSEMHQNIQDRFHEAGVEIASPHLAALRDGNAAQIPDDYLPKDYRVPGFRFLGFGGGNGDR